MVLNKLKVRTRIYAGFALIIAIGLGVAGFGVFQLSNIDTQVRAMDVSANTLSRMLETSWNLEAMRRGETRYRMDADKAALAEVKDHAGRVRTLLMSQPEGGKGTCEPARSDTLDTVGLQTRGVWGQ